MLAIFKLVLFKEGDWMIWKSESWKYGGTFLRKQVSIRETDCFKFITTQFLQTQPTLLKVFGLQKWFLIVVNWNRWKFKPQTSFWRKIRFGEVFAQIDQSCWYNFDIFSNILFHLNSLKAEGIIFPGCFAIKGRGTCVYNNMNFLFHQSRVSSDYPRLQKTGEPLPLSEDQSEVRRNFVCSSMSHKERLSTSKSKRFWLMFTNRNIGFVGSQIMIKF